MAEARDRAAWNRTFALEAVLYNSFRGADDEPIDPMQFFPWQVERTDRPHRVTPEIDAALSRMYPGNGGVRGEGRGVREERVTDGR